MDGEGERAERQRGEALNLGHSGLGGSNQLCGLLLQHAAGRGATQIVFRGSAPAMTEMMAGRLDISCEQATVAAPFIRDGRIKGYAVTLPERVPGLDLPTTAEAQVPLTMSAWHGLYAAGGTPPELQARLAQSIRAALREERLMVRYAETLTTVATAEDATVVPAEAVQLTSTTAGTVQVRAATGKTRTVDVTVGISTPTQVQILKGVSRGDTVLIVTPTPVTSTDDGLGGQIPGGGDGSFGGEQ